MGQNDRTILSFNFCRAAIPCGALIEVRQGLMRFNRVSYGLIGNLGLRLIGEGFEWEWGLFEFDWPRYRV